MKIPRWVSVVGLLSSTALLFGCGMAGSASSTKSGGLAVTTAALPDATVSQTYSGTLQATGGTTPYSWTVTNGALPTGLSLSTSGQISGTPTTSGTYAFQVQVTDASKKSSSGNIGMKVTGPPPSIYSVSPTFGNTAGGTPVTISGKNLQSGATVTFDGLNGTSVTVVNSSEMTAVTPPHAAGSVDVTITNPGGKSATLAAGFGYGSAAPSVSAIDPNSGPTSGGTAVTITGSNFVVGALVFFGTVAATGINVNSATQIQATTPSVSTAAAVDVVVKNSDGQSGSLNGGFTYTDAPSSSSPSVTDVSPDTVTQGTNVAVDGTNFASGATVNVGSTAASNVKFMSSTQLTMNVPNVSSGTYDVTVTNSNGLSATLTSGLTVTDPKSLLSGCTVDASNKPSCAIPSGWTLAVADGFDTKTLANSTNEGLHGSKIECTFAHNGSCAVVSNHTADDQTFHWYLNNAINGREFYLSWWEYLTPGATNQTPGQNFELAQAASSASSPLQKIFYDRWAKHDDCLNGVGPGNQYNCQNSQPVLSSVSNYPSQGGVNQSHYTNMLDLNLGTWRQYEWHFIANTPGNSDGSAEIYINGQLWASFSGVNWNGTIDMTNMSLWVGGIYAAWKYTDSSGATCVVPSSSGSVHQPCAPFSACSPCPIPPDFQQYWDDIIVLRK